MEAVRGVAPSKFQVTSMARAVSARQEATATKAEGKIAKADRRRVWCIGALRAEERS